MVFRADAGSWLRRVRRDLRLSQRDFAANADVSQSLVARVESGRVDPRLGVVIQLLDVAGYDLVGVTRAGRLLRPFDTTGARDLGGRHFPAHRQIFRLERGEYDDYSYSLSSDPFFAVELEDDRDLPPRGVRRPTPRVRRGRPEPRRGPSSRHGSAMRR